MATTMRAQLVPLEGGSPIEITKDMTLVGRKEECDLCLNHKSVSKMHCVIVKTDGLLLLRDLGSTNGTRVNGQRIRRAALLPNDQVSIAHYKFRVFLGAGGPAPMAAPVHDRTQQIDAKEIAAMARRKDDGPSSKDDQPEGDFSLRPNMLPDVYPDDGGGQK